MVRVVRVVHVVGQGDRLRPLVKDGRVRCGLMVATDVVLVMQVQAAVAVELRLRWCRFAKFRPQAFVCGFDAFATFLDLKDKPND